MLFSLIFVPIIPDSFTTVSLVGQFLGRTFIGVAKTSDKGLFALGGPLVVLAWADEVLLGRIDVMGDEVVDLL